MSRTTNTSIDNNTTRARTGDASGSPATMADANITVLRGPCANGTPRELPGGGTVIQFDVITRVAVDGRERSAAVPVAWYDPPATWRDVVGGDGEILVIGAVQRRFFRVGGATQSRTEVRALRVVPASRRREVRRALDGVIAALT